MTKRNLQKPSLAEQACRSRKWDFGGQSHFWGAESAPKNRRFTYGAGEGNRTLVVSLGSSTKNPANMRLCALFLLHKSHLAPPRQASIHAGLFWFVEQNPKNILLILFFAMTSIIVYRAITEQKQAFNEIINFQWRPIKFSALFNRQHATEELY